MEKYSWTFTLTDLKFLIFEYQYIKSVHSSKLSNNFFPLWLAFTSYEWSTIVSDFPYIILLATHGSYGLNLNPSVSKYFISLIYDNWYYYIIT